MDTVHIEPALDRYYYIIYNCLLNELDIFANKLILSERELMIGIHSRGLFVFGFHSVRPNLDFTCSG